MIELLLPHRGKCLKPLAGLKGCFIKFSDDEPFEGEKQKNKQLKQKALNYETRLKKGGGGE